MTDPLRMLQAALDETIARCPPYEDHCRSALIALAGDLRAIAHGTVDQVSHHPARTWDDLPWTHFHDGIESVELSSPKGGDATAALLRYRAGASVPHHLHEGDEHIVILSGSQRDERGFYGCGATVFNPAGSAHSVISSEGCVVGICWEKPVSFPAGGQTDPNPTRQDS
ncbi:MAG TPA: cupin domain-containing protein [Micropepsaceae bacterium]|nr:cupin domain-containing protein [Micropepsaceae bacterium]